MIQAVIFDMDGTIFDTEKLLFRAWKELVRRGIVPEFILEYIPKWRGRNRRDVRKLLTQLLGESFDVDAFYRTRRNIIGEILDAEGVPLKAGVPEIFQSLKAMGYPLALATATNEDSVADYMRRTGYGEYFDVIITGNRVSVGKPAPDIFLLTARELGIEPERCLVIEDSPNGVKAGIAAGMKVIMVPDLEQPDAILRSKLWHCCETLSEIPPLLAFSTHTTEKEK